MLINAWNRSEGETRSELNHWLGVSEFDREEKIKAVTNIYNNLGIDKLAEVKIKECFDESRKYLDAISVADERKQVLREYTEKMMNRKK